MGGRAADHREDSAPFGAGGALPVAKRSRESFRGLGMQARAYAASALPAGDIKPFCIVITTRTGSELLVELLDAHPRIRCDGELMAYRPLFPYRFVRGRMRVARRRGAAAYGFKMTSAQLVDFFNPPDERLINRLAADGFQFIHLRRRNLLRQAISLLRAVDNREFHRRAPVAVEKRPLTVDVPRLIFWMHFIEAHDQILESLLESLPQRTLWYEDDLEQPDVRQRTIDGLCHMLGIGTHPVVAKMEKIATPDIADDVANFDEVARQLGSTRYAVYLGS